jgi:ligand-binding sensor domain-containing protein
MSVPNQVIKLLMFHLPILLMMSCGHAMNSSVHQPENLSRLGEQISGDTVQHLGKNIMTVLQDQQHNIWFASWEDGVYCYNGKILLHYTTAHGLSHNRVDEIREDARGNVYFNTQGGINKFDGSRFSELEVSPFALNAWKLEKDDLWFRCLNQSGHVFRYDGELLHRLHFTGSERGDSLLRTDASGNGHNSTLDPYAVYTIYKDQSGNIWFGTAALGACRFNGRDFLWLQEDDLTELHDGPANGVRGIAEDKNGDFWMNTIARYRITDSHEMAGNPRQQKGYMRLNGIGSMDGKKDGVLNEFMSVAKDNNGDMWIVTYNEGVWKYNGHDLEHFEITDGRKQIHIFSVSKDNNGVMWLGTHEHGAYFWNGERFESFMP